MQLNLAVALSCPTWPSLSPLCSTVAAPLLRSAVAAPRASPVAYAPAEWDDGWYEDGLTCVEFVCEGERRLGVYVHHSVVEPDPHIRPLCASSEDDGVRVLLHDEEAAPAPISSVTRILDPDVVFVSERQAGGGQGLGNPHGEHGEECYDLSELELSPDVRVVVREGRDTERVL
mmetsp:Transcript_24733/g.79095  ORF Transcript_24733/g.79095 Transcript_24733/m.79095 type:complete len:174 (-) Transcript_24733:98-619(-)